MLGELIVYPVLKELKVYISECEITDLEGASSGSLGSFFRCTQYSTTYSTGAVCI